MKTSVAIAVLCIHIVSCQDLDLTFGKICKDNKQCKSQHCIPICDGVEKACTEPDWYYLRHAKEIPTCMKSSYTRRNIGSIPFVRERLIGHSCHNDTNCQSKHCLPMCESASTMWRCLEPRSFFERQKLDMPKCVKLSYITSYMKEENKKKKETERASIFSTNLKGSKIVETKEETVPSRGLGQTCSQHLECFSDHCVYACTESSKFEEKESRCIEPRMSFTMYNLPVPNCVGEEAMNDLVKLVDTSTTTDKDGNSNIEEIIWKRLHLLSSPDDVNISKSTKEKIKSLDSSKATKHNEEPKSSVKFEKSKKAERGNGSWVDLYSSLRGEK